MRFRIFEHITPAEEDMPLCNLAHLFNGYMDRLHTLEVAAYPQETLREYRKLTAGLLKNLRRADQEKARLVRTCEQEYYHLSLVNNSLHDIHLCVLGACNALADLFNLYDGDLHRYAVQNRLKVIAETVPGTDEEMREDPEFYAEFVKDWEPVDPSNPEGPQQVKYKDDAESIAPYAMKADLVPYFSPLNEWTTVETIGSTLPEEWDYLTETVRTASTSRLKFSSLSENAGVYRRNAEGYHEHQSVAQRVQNEVNDELSDVRVAYYFQQIMQRLQYAAGLSVFLTDSASYLELYRVLVTVRDCTLLKEPEQPFV